MRAGSVIPLLVGLTSLAAAQEAPVRVYPGERLVSLTAGVGNAMGWFGAQGERYFLDERLSIFLGVGYTPQIDPGDPTGPTFAAGLRSFTSGLKHRFFLEASASQLVLETEGADGGGRHYGPGLQGGYQFVSAGGLTLMASVGAGYALGVPRGGDPWATQVGLGLGYTWRRPIRVSGPIDRRRM
jgi:hypothetical protein